MWSAVIVIVVTMCFHVRMRSMCPIITALTVCAGVWSCPATTGDRPPPCSHFTFTAVDERRTVMFGGFNTKEDKMNSVYIIDLLTMVKYFH